MKILIALLIFAVCGVCSQSMAQQKQPDEGGCREAISQMLNMMKTVPLTTQRDIDRNKELISRVEDLMADHRSKGISDCRTWAEIMKMLAHQ